MADVCSRQWWQSTSLDMLDTVPLSVNQLNLLIS